MGFNDPSGRLSSSLGGRFTFLDVSKPERHSSSGASRSRLEDLCHARPFGD